MARIPIYQKQFTTLTAVVLQPSTNYAGQLQTDVNGIPIASKINTQPLYIDATQIFGITEYYDPSTAKYLNLRLIYIGVGMLPIIVTETYAELQIILDGIDCTKLCTDT